MRFLLSALAAVALVSTVSAQDYSNEDLLNERDFDISGGAIRSVKQEFKSLPVQQKQKIQAPVQQPKYEAPVQQVKESPIMMKEKTFMLQPILLMPKQRSKARKMLKLDVDRAMAYRVSPKVSSENSRSVDITFSPILNAKMRNVLLSGEEEQHSPRESFVEISPLLSKYQSKQVKAPVQYQYRAPVQQQSKWSGLHGVNDVDSYETPSSYLSSNFNRLQGLQGLQNVNEEQFQFLNEQPTSPRSYQFTQDVEQPRFQNPYMNTFMNEDVSDTLLSSFDSTLPSVPITEKNIVSLGIQQPMKLNQILKTCIANNVNTPICTKVIESAKLLVRHQVAAKVFEGIQI